MSAANNIAIELSNRLGTITVTNGFQTDIGTNVFRGKRRLEEANLPCVVIMEGDDSVTATSLKSASIFQQYFFEGHAACDPNNPNDKAHDIIADLKKAVFNGDLTFGRTIRKIDYKGRSIATREDGTPVVAASIHVEVQFVEDLTNP